MPGRLRVGTRLARISLILLGSLAVGCGRAEKGYPVSGKVTFKGQAVPAGKVYILPDGSKGNSGAAGFADIKNGAYDTSAPGGRGAAPGAVIIAVEGIDPNRPPNADPDVTTTVLFARYEMKAELPQSASVQNIDVPAEAANGPPQPEESPGVVP